MSGSSDYYDSDSDSDDESLALVDVGLRHVRAQDRLEDLIREYTHNGGELPWRVFMHASDPFVLWSCATGVSYRGPVYSDEPTENGIPFVLEHAKYVASTRHADLEALIPAVRNRLDTNEMKEFEEQLFEAEPHPYNIVGFITRVLYICNIQCSPENICYLILELPSWNML